MRGLRVPGCDRDVAKEAKAHRPNGNRVMPGGADDRKSGRGLSTAWMQVFETKSGLQEVKLQKKDRTQRRISRNPCTFLSVQSVGPSSGNILATGLMACMELQALRTSESDKRMDHVSMDAGLGQPKSRHKSQPSGPRSSIFKIVP